MNPLLHWYNLIFELPAALAAVLLVLSTVRIGHGAQHHGTIAHHLSGGHAPQHTGHDGRHAPESQRDIDRAGSQFHANGQTQMAVPVAPAKWRSTPSTAVAGFFGLFWGVCGFLCNTIFIGSAPPTFSAIVKSIVAAMAVGLVAARGGAEFLGRVMPPDETYAVSRDGLYGLTGKVAFEVSDHTGRLLVYDDHGTLHDEMCRCAKPGATIDKGSQVIIVDRNQEGQLLVEEVSG